MAEISAHHLYTPMLLSIMALWDSQLPREQSPKDPLRKLAMKCETLSFCSRVPLWAIEKSSISLLLAYIDFFLLLLLSLDFLQKTFFQAFYFPGHLQNEFEMNRAKGKEICYGKLYLVFRFMSFSRYKMTLEQFLQLKEEKICPCRASSSSKRVFFFFLEGNSCKCFLLLSSDFDFQKYWVANGCGYAHILCHFAAYTHIYLNIGLMFIIKVTCIMSL